MARAEVDPGSPEEQVEDAEAALEAATANSNRTPTMRKTDSPNRLPANKSGQTWRT